MAVEPGQERDAGLVVPGRRGEHLPRERFGGTEDAAVLLGVVAVERADRRRRARRERGERAEQGIRVAGALPIRRLALDQ
jgi:hypothetical protein